MRLIPKLIFTLFPIIGLTGCYYFPDLQNSPVYHAPVAEVANQIKCDIYDFLSDRTDKQNDVFSLDKGSYATVELLVNVTEFGDAKYSKIRTEGLHAQKWLAVGNAVDPFPSFDMKATGQTQAKIQMDISQDRSILERSCGRPADVNSQTHRDALINRIRLREWLNKTFNEARDIKHGPVCNSGPVKNPGANDQQCDIALETATLITKFELYVDMSGGLLALGKLIPVVAVPTLELNKDYYHQLTIIFHGNNDLKVPQAALPGTQQNTAMKTGLKKLYKADTPNADILAGQDAISQTNALIIRELRSIRDATVLNAPH